MVLRSSSIGVTGPSPERTVFDVFHPAIALAYFASMLVLCMAAMQPVCLILSLIGAAAYAALLRGWRASVRSAVWQAPLVVVLAVANPLFSASGSTELFHIGLRAVYLESLVYGLCMGLMLVTVLLAFSNASRVLTSDKVMELTGTAVPVIGLMLSMTARLVPQFVRRGADIASVHRACTATRAAGFGIEDDGGYRSDRQKDRGASGGGTRGGSGRQARSHGKIAGRLRQVSVLMGWSMEDSLETAAAMKARGWGAGVRRSVYARHRFKHADALALAVVLALGALAAASAWFACASFTFYPVISGFAPWWVYVPFALFALLPVAFEAGERARWRS